MVNNVSLKKAQGLRRKSMLVGMRFMQEKVAADKVAEHTNVANNHPKVNENTNNNRPS